MQVICLEEPALYVLIEQCVARLKEQHGQGKEKWIPGSEAMKLLNITSRTTLQKFRDQGDIRYTVLEKKIILYDRDSIMEFLNRNSRETF